MRSITQHLRLIALFYLVMLLIFDFQRVLFILHNWGELSNSSALDFLETFVYSIPLDLATASYIIAFPSILIIIFGLSSRVIRVFLKGWFFLFFALFAMVHSGEIIVYEEWHHKLSSRVFTHLSNPDEVVRTASLTMTLLYIIYALFEFTFSYRIWRWLIKNNLIEGAILPSKIAHRIVVIPFLILGI